MKRILIVLVVLLLVHALLIVCVFLPYRSAALQAHVADDIEPLETENLFDTPDFILYTKGGKTVQLSPELQAKVVAELERLMTLEFNGVLLTEDEHNADLDTHVFSMKQSGAIRFCYTKRRKFKGKIWQYNPYRDVIENKQLPWGYKYEEIAIDKLYWEALQYDEIIFQNDEIFLGIDGKYRKPSTSKYYSAYYDVNTREIVSEVIINCMLPPPNAKRKNSVLTFYNDDKQKIFFSSMVDIAEAGLAG
jgi:hypothetical protein